LFPKTEKKKNLVKLGYSAYRTGKEVNIQRSLKPGMIWLLPRQLVVNSSANQQDGETLQQWSKPSIGGSSVSLKISRQSEIKI